MIRNQSALTDRLSVAVLAARAAGDILRQGFQSGSIAFSTKAHRHDVVTKFDLAADRIIVDALRGAFPEDGILTEERGQSVVSPYGQWVIDPLDGTNNFSKSIPHFAVSIAFCDQQGPRVACIYDPVRDEMFTATQEMGAHLNGQSIQTSSQSGLEGAFLCVGTSFQPILRHHIHEQMPPFLQTARALRTTGCAALDLAYVAAGRYDAAWYPQLSWWDVAAGILLIDEAGGCSTDYDGKRITDEMSSIVASNGPLHPPILAVVGRR